MASPSPCHVKITDCVYKVCIGHAMMTEREEVMGLLLGEVAGQDVHIWASLTLQRSDKRPDRCEISPEQLVEATVTAERLSEESGRKTTVVGWYHSHPHITCLPSHVDLRTQMQYQCMDSSFVGLIFAVFNANPRKGSMRHELMAFRSTTTSPPERVDLLVVVVQLCEVLSEEEERKALDSGCLGGCMGPSAMVSTARNVFAELVGDHTEELQAHQGPGYSLARVDASLKHSLHLTAMLSNEIVTLEQHYQDAAHNTGVLAVMHRERNASARSQPLIWASPWCIVAPPNPSVSAAATLEVASPARAGVGAGSAAPAETAGGAAAATNGLLLEASAAAWSETLCMARVFDKEKSGAGKAQRAFKQCSHKRATSSDVCAHWHRDTLPCGRMAGGAGQPTPQLPRAMRAVRGGTSAAGATSSPLGPLIVAEEPAPKARRLATY
jgi:proteasome lid subunit RPN8/RPN11